MSDTATPATTPTQQAALAPDQLDALALQLVALQSQIHAMGSVVQAMLVSVSQLLAARGKGGAQRTPLTRAALDGLTGQVGENEPKAPPATFNKHRADSAQHEAAQ